MRKLSTDYLLEKKNRDLILAVFKNGEIIPHADLIPVNG
jgi:hypothetical protein